MNVQKSTINGFIESQVKNARDASSITGKLKKNSLPVTYPAKTKAQMIGGYAALIKKRLKGLFVAVKEFLDISTSLRDRKATPFQHYVYINIK